MLQRGVTYFCHPGGSKLETDVKPNSTRRELESVIDARDDAVVSHEGGHPNGLEDCKFRVAEAWHCGVTPLSWRRAERHKRAPHCLNIRHFDVRGLCSIHSP